ncbi:hypothetical protein C8R48DRAFT_751326 [Suillus tomentosus]|nr:hypothetical protein C8R48DRAFT_751326 [Suillus tomentosus]
MNKAIRVPGVKQSNQIGELVAVLVALQTIDPLAPAKIIMDSKRHPSLTTFKWIKGHQSHIRNEKADQLTLTGALHPVPDNLDTYVPGNFDIQGAKLTYKVIMNKTHLKYSRTTLGLLDITRYAVEALMSSQETDSVIWKGCRHKDISKKIQMSLYKILNSTYCIGGFWAQIPTYEHRAICQLCQGLILGCRVITLPRRPNNNNNNHRTLPGALRLLRILISKLAYLIWTMRCERIIKDNTHTEMTTKNAAIASQVKRNTKMAKTIQGMWSDIIEFNSQHPQDDWMTNIEVLVGISLFRPSQTMITR